jgi:ribulose-5-phosphate 4-epimerase/fuculose-1-phosphate aldolase
MNAVSEPVQQPGFATDFPSLRGVVSDAEWQARCDLAACYRLMDRYGMTDMIYNHITAAIPDKPGSVLINLYGLLYKEITASSLVEIDLDGRILRAPESAYTIGQSGFVIHGCIHKARPDVHCIVHTHTRAGMAVSSMKCGLLPLTQTSSRFHGHIGYHDFEGPAVDKSEQARLVADLGPHNAMVLRNHGLLVCGATVRQAFNFTYQLEMACRAQVDAMAGGMDQVQLPDPAAFERSAHLFQPGTRRPYGELEWHALMRWLAVEPGPYPRHDS